MHAHVIVNRRARRFVGPGRLFAELRRARPGIELIETNSLAELDAVSRAVRTYGRERAVVLAGGDGSHMAGVSALARAFGDAPLPPIAFAPGGTVGTVARNWGMSGEPVRYVARLLDAIADGSVRKTRRPTLRIREVAPRAHGEPRADGDDVGATNRVGFIFGAGLVARFFELYEARGASGNLTAARIAARVFAGSFVGSRFARDVLRPTSCSLDLDGSPAPFDRMSLLCASVVRDLGLGLRLTYRAGSSLDRFHAVATPLGPRALGPQMPLVLAARPLVGTRVDSLVEELRLRFPEGTGAYVLDGDLFRADAVTVTAGPVLDVLG